MTSKCAARPALSPLQLAGERDFRRWSNLSLAKEALIAVALLAGIGLVLSIGSSALNLVGFQ
jgi:hypothetical protein